MVKNLEIRNNDIETMVPYWDEVTAILQGKSAITEGKEQFLPRFPDESVDDYNFRLKTAKFTNVYRDVVEGLASKPFQDEVSLVKGDGDKPIEIPGQVKEFIENVDGCGNNLTSFAALTFFNGINFAIDWIFIDYPNVDNGAVVTRAEAKAKNLRPYWRHVLGKNVIAVETMMVGAQEVVTHFRYTEPSFGTDMVHVKDFSLTPEGVIWRDYVREPNMNSELEYTEVGNGKLSIGFIPVVPFVTGRRDGNSFRFYPPMQDVADLQITLYQNETALEYIKTLACYPMLSTEGIRPKTDATGTPLKIGVGPGRVLYGVPMQNGATGGWKYVEPNANSLEFLQKNIEKTKTDLRELGRQPLTALSSQLTTVTTSIAAGKAKSAVTAWAYALKDALENALKITCEWMELDYEPEVNVYTGFDNVLDDGSDLTELGAARRAGDISLETYWEELKRRKVLSPEFNAGREKERLLADIPLEDDESDIDNLKKGLNNDLESR